MPKKPTKKKAKPPAAEPAPSTALAAPEPQGPGRPSSYTPDFARQAAALCSYGATDVQLAEYFGVSDRTINRWKLSYPEFHEALKAGKDGPDACVERSLYHRAMGLEYERAHPIKLKKIVYGSDGKKLAEEERIEIVMVKEVVPPDTTAMIFWLKNRKADDWRDVQRHEHGGVGEFKRMTDEELAARVEESTQRLNELIEARELATEAETE